MDLGLKGQNVVVTGSSRGIGRGIAEEFLREKANVIITGRDQSELEKTAEELCASTGSTDVKHFAADLAGEAGLRDLGEFIKAEVGHFDHLVCNVGGGKSLPPAKEDAAEVQRMLDVNLMTAVNAVKLLSPLMLPKTSGGVSRSITCIGSICGVEALGCPTGYAVAKAALESFVKNASRPMARKGIRLNIVSPGNILFPGSTWEKKLAEDRTAVEAMLERDVPLGILGEPQNVAGVVVFLASARASFVSGANWIVDGGQTRC